MLNTKKLSEIGEIIRKNSNIFKIYADFECLNIPFEYAYQETNTDKISKQIPLSNG